LYTIKIIYYKAWSNSIICIRWNDCKDIFDTNEKNREYRSELWQLQYERQLQEEKANNALNIFNRRKNELISSFSNELVEYASNNEDFCKKDMNKEYENYIFEINECIDQISDIENKENVYHSRINHSIANIAQKMDECEINHLNILLIGL
jgi:ABC-type phosphate transport system auxiliary subunit